MRIMYDSVDPLRIPADATMVACYVDGLYANSNTARKRFPHARLVEIAISSHTDSGQVLDVETGDATPAGAVSWVQMRRRAGADPSVYCNASTWPSVEAAFHNAGIGLPHFWIAHYGIAPKIPAGAVALQYESTSSYDVSVVEPYWPGVDPKPVAKKPVQMTGKYHVVVKGDTLYGIALKYGLSLSQIEKLNPQIKHPNLIYPGEKVYV